MSDNKKFYAASFALTKLKHALITTKKGTRCIMLPIDDNYLLEKDGAIYMQTDICVRETEDQNKNYGFVKQKLTSEKYKELGSDAAKAVELPFLANLKVFERANNDSSGALPAEIYNGEEEDNLPF